MVMTKNDLSIAISPALAEALSIAATPDGVDYFSLFGLPRDQPAPASIDKALMERSKALRQWQSSSQYGPEVVLLLKTLHRAAKILKDPKRCGAYREELERAERGEEASASDEFEGLVRAAMADGQLSQDSRKELNDFISGSGLDHALAQKIVARVRDELQTQRKQAAASASGKPQGVAEDDGWTFRIAEKGDEGFALMLRGAAQSGELGRLTPGQLLVEAQRYDVPADRAAKLIAEARSLEFGSIVRIVADGRAISEAQARLLLGKAATYGLDHEQALEIISEYTLSARDPNEAYKLALAETFDQEEISQIVDNSGIQRRRRSLLKTLLMQVPDWARNLILLVIGLGVLAMGAMTLLKHVDTDSGGDSGAAGSAAASPGRAAPDTAAETAAGQAGTSATSTVAEESQTLAALPDPPSGFLTLEAEQPNDPPAFEIAICEVTCEQFQEFLRATLEPAPPGWTAAGNPPGGALRRPVTDISWDRAMAYCQWLARRNSWPVESVTLPSAAEFIRAARYRGIRGMASDPNIWTRTRLGEAKGPADAMQTRWDKWFVTGKGQLYDLLGNVAEWSREREGGLAPILGGEFGLTDPTFNPLKPRLVSADTGAPTIGFRIVRHNQ